MDYETILVERERRVAVATLNRPAFLNAMNAQLRRELLAALEELEADSEIAAVIITGAGDRAFSAGADINELKSLGPLEAASLALEWHRLLGKVEELSKPVIGAVNGLALGGGCELGMACDVRVAAETARFGQPEINLGLLPGAGGTQRLPRLVGRGRALEMILTGQIIPASEAYRIGLVNRVVPAERLMPECHELAQVIASRPPIAVRLIKEAVRYGLDTGLEAGCAFEGRQFASAFATEDAREGIAAFLEKRQPVFKGR